MKSAYTGAFLAVSLGLVLTAHVAPALGPTAILVSYAVCFLPYLFLLHAESRGQTETLDVRWIVAALLLIRVVAAFAEPVLSDDIYRYVWEGRVSAAGHNPFASAPNAPELAGLRDSVIWPRINHPEVSSIYPPVAQYVFALVAVLGGGTTAMRLVLIAVESLAGWFAYRLLKPARRRFALVCYGLNPLVVLEIAWSGHLDVLAWMPLALALLIVANKPATARWALASGTLLGLSIASKFLGLLILPYLALRHGLRRQFGTRVLMLCVAAVVVATSYLGFIDAREKLLRGFGTYAAAWRNNDGLFRAITAASEHALQGGSEDKRIFSFSALDAAATQWGFTKTWEGQELPNTSFASDQIAQALGKGLALLAVALALLYCVLVVRDPIRATVLVLLTLYFFAPTVHPWYVGWLVPLAALRWSATSVAFSAAVLLGYASWWSVAQGGAWAAPWWVVAVEYLGVFAVGVYEAGRSERSQPASAAS